MRFRGRKGADPEPVEEAPAPTTTGPFDIADVDLEHDEVDRLDVGALLLNPGEGRQVQLQIDERTQAVQAVLIASSEGALEVRAFAAPVGESLWEEMRPELAEQARQRGGTVAERQGRWGAELVCQTPVRLQDGRTGTQSTRVLGIDGPRWLLRATCYGQPAVSPEAAQAWEDVLAKVVVRRGAHAMPPGDQLPFTLPASARRQG